MDRGELMSVRTELVMETIVSAMHEEALRREGVPPADREARLERLGELARELELERFAPARAAMPWLAQALSGRDAEEVVGELAAAEPEGRPQPDDPTAVTWQVPGPGGHVRHFLALRAAEAVAPAHAAEQRPGLKRAWVRGFLRACAREARRL